VNVLKSIVLAARRRHVGNRRHLAGGPLPSAAVHG
jgi:hypothetical protein